MGADQRANPFSTWKRSEGVSQAKLYDRNGRELGVGDVVHLLNKSDIFWRVQSVTPVLDPKAPAGLIELQLVAVFLTGVPGGRPITDVLKTRDASENQTGPAGPAGPATPGDTLQ